MDLSSRALVFLPHALPGDRTHQIQLSAMDYLSIISSALGKMNKSSHKLLNYSIAIIVCFCCVCLVLAIAVNSSGSKFSTPTPIQIFDTSLPISTLIAFTYSAARTQTAVLYPAQLSTATLALPIENIPTSTIFIFQLQTNVAQPTSFIYSTNTPYSLATQPPSSGDNCEPAYPDVCIHASPRLNCVELRKLSIFHFRVLPPDPLGYDKDNDGIGCE